jgi:hypothetical protein
MSGLLHAIWSGIVMIYSVFFIALAGMVYQNKKSDRTTNAYKFSVGMLVVGVLAFVGSMISMILNGKTATTTTTV